MPIVNWCRMLSRFLSRPRRALVLLIIPSFVRHKFQILNGKSYIGVTITEDMVGYMLGEFAVRVYIWRKRWLLGYVSGGGLLVTIVMRSGEDSAADVIYGLCGFRASCFSFFEHWQKALGVFWNWRRPG